MIMTPQEKAKEIYGKFYEAAAVQMFNESRGWYLDEKESSINAKACVIISVDEIIGSYNQYKDMYDQGTFDAEKNYWNDVKKQIELL